jgi:hypothetical protein
MSLPQEFENAAKAEVKLYQITEEERTHLVTDPRFGKAAYLAQELCHSQQVLRPDLDHLKVDGELDLSEENTTQTDRWDIEAYRDFIVSMKAAEDVATQVAQATLGREIEKHSVEELLKAGKIEITEGQL